MFSRIFSKPVAVLAILLVAGAVLLYRTQFAPVEVDLYRVKTSDVQATAFGTGTLEPLVRGAVSAKVQGRITEMLADENQRVTSGQLLARLDDEQLRKEVEIAESELEASRAAVARAQADLAKSLAVHSNAQLSHERNAKLLKSSTISLAEFDKSREELRVAAAAVRHAEAATAEAERNVVAASQRADYRRSRLRETEIRAPFDALIIQRAREVGDVAVPGATIFGLITLEKLRIAAWVDEREIAQVKLGAAAWVRFHSDPGHEYQARVVHLGSEVDRDTREFVVEVQPDALPEQWAIGQRADVRIATKLHENVPVVSVRLIQWRNGSAHVVALRDNRAHVLPVQLGISDDLVVEIKEGLRPGDPVVDGSSAPKLKLRNGRRLAQR